uniref:Unk like zinc finger n=1 Tax=Scleropages formosus TaxID=113540 RepID=A0A8D0CJU5_SCLFO
MPSVSKTAVSASPQTEKPTHYTYLKEFRTEQCPLFLQHKCTQHRPFTCFHWHFLNQRRRRPIRRRDGTFNYSPDVYCTKYDETTGICPDGDDCPYLHRTTGDTERKYHLRYYKTGSCIHETDARGHCVKNGLHCAFAHGPHDLRPPVYDIREVQAQEALQNGQLGAGEGIPDLQPGVLASQAMIEKILTEDPRWQDTNFVLANYKTEQCTKPPRLCRQGYACPHYHNSRDRRRNPRKFKYRSTPCPNVKHGDEWGEPAKCDSGDSCQYCHSRTEQQFHPEIYKSTKCNDMRQTELTFLFFPLVHGSFLSDSTEGESNLISVFSTANPLGCNITSSITSSLASSVGSDSSSPTTLSTMNAKAAPFYPGSNTVESVIGSALDLNFTDINVASLDEELEEQDNGDIGLTSHSAPVNIPGSLARSSSLHSSSSLSASPLGSLSQSLLSGMAPQQSQAQTPRANAECALLGTSVSSQNTLGLNGGAGSSIWDFVSGNYSPSPSPVFSTVAPVTSSSTDLSQLRRELEEARRKIEQWEEAWRQVKQACDAWQKDAQDAREQAEASEGERQRAAQRRQEAERRLQELQENFDAACRSPGAPLLRSYGELDQLPLPKLLSIQNQLRTDLELIDTVIYQLQSKKCIVCQKHDRCIVLQPCQHYVLCGNCAPSKTECPYCETKILSW